MSVSAQVSLYPLKQDSLSPAIEEALDALHSKGLLVYSGVMSSFVTGDEEAIFAGLREAFRRAGQHGPTVMVVTVSNACPVPGRQQ
jgi:uncharacterized protein YqgV (UPF0045/DUF77 family)